MNKRLVSTFILITYCAILVKVMVFKDMPTIRIGPLMLNFSGTDGGHAPNFVPLRTILPYLLGYKGFIIAAINLIGNIVLLVPLGFLVPFVYRNITWKNLLVLAITAGLSIEVMQVVLGVGIFDIDDIILNALGVMIGYWSFVMLTKWLRSKNYKNIVVAAMIVIAASAAMLYGMYPKGQQSAHYRSSTDSLQSDRINKKEVEIPPGDDPCGGTGGTGQITGVENNAITIWRNNGTSQTFQFTGRTTIRSSAGPASKSDLKIGDRVTLVIDESETASLVLICNVSNANNQ
jgi:glycopeptide antibiotics resistance protein